MKRTVGKPSTLNFFARSSFCFFSSFGSSFLRGKSTSSRTTFFLAQSWNSLVPKTSAPSLMHPPHQSLPEKSARMTFFSFLAVASAFS
jgi:hypothetical protein